MSAIRNYAWMALAILLVTGGPNAFVLTSAMTALQPNGLSCFCTWCDSALSPTECSDSTTRTVDFALIASCGDDSYRSCRQPCKSAFGSKDFLNVGCVKLPVAAGVTDAIAIAAASSTSAAVTLTMYEDNACARENATRYKYETGACLSTTKLYGSGADGSYYKAAWQETDWSVVFYGDMLCTIVVGAYSGPSDDSVCPLVTYTRSDGATGSSHISVSSGTATLSTSSARFACVAALIVSVFAVTV